MEINGHRFLMDSVGQDRVSTSANTGLLTFRGQYHLINKEKFNMYVGTKIGWSGLNLYLEDTSGTTGSIQLEGTAIGLNFGFRKYFGKTFGIRFETGFMHLPMRADAFYVNSVSQEYVTDWLTVEDFKAQFTGGYVNFGITFKIGKNKKTTTETPS